MDLDHYSSTPASPTSNLDPSSIPMDAPSPTPLGIQPEIPDFHVLHLASDPKARLTTIKGALVNIEAALLCLLHNSQNTPLPAPNPATPAPAVGPDFSTLTPTAKLVLPLNPWLSSMATEPKDRCSSIPSLPTFGWFRRPS
jgi:hypothetical protein